MRKIKIFLASSIEEFKQERIKIGNLTREIQDFLIDYKIEIELFKCEFASKCVAKTGRKQDETNIKLKNSDIFVMLLGKSIGIYTMEEYKIAKSVDKIKKYIIFYNKLNHIDDCVVELKKTQTDTKKYNCNNWSEVKKAFEEIIFKNIQN